MSTEIDPLAEPCYTCDELASTNRVCTVCNDPCCKKHFVSINGVVYCNKCHAKDTQYFTKTGED